MWGGQFNVNTDRLRQPNFIDLVVGIAATALGLQGNIAAAALGFSRLRIVSIATTALGFSSLRVFAPKACRLARVGAPLHDAVLRLCS